jgi:PAS domain S-box-containing protein
MNEATVHRRNFLLHLQERAGYDGPVLLKEPAHERPTRSHLDQLHNEYAITRQLTDVAGVRPVYAKEGTESQPVLLMEYIQGQSLAELIRANSLDLAEKFRLAVNVTTVLSRIHEQQVMHKDLSSNNILVASKDKPGSQYGVYVIDFGIASFMQQESVSILTTDDTLVGTLAYISPEQTRRMNRNVDYRTDFYSLGVILYELFTGQLPFESSDLLELIHDHIARQPRPPHEIESGIPGPVSDIVLRLLAKNAEDRYQTAHGLLADLDRCFDQWQRKGRIEPFELGGDDFTGRLQIPQKLYGRQAEIKYLQTIFDRAVTEQAHLLLVAGYSGVGKTSLVHEIQEHAMAKQGIYIEGKFDQLQRTRPYSAWEQAFTQLVDNWLAQSEISFAGWQDTILDTVGDHGQVLTDIIPALEPVLGPQPDVPQLGGVENQNRINHFFNRFISCVATPEHPLVVFLDDLQWIDSASLNLIEALFADQSASRLLVIGAYRSNEVDAAHPLAVSQDRMQAASDRVTVLTLEDLPLDDTNHLLADSLQLSVADCRDLGQVLVEKSAGNPFFFRQLLYALETDGLLRFDRDQRRWMWDDAVGQSLQARGSVVDLMIAKIRTLPGDTQHALSMAACIGSRFDTSTLHTIVGQAQTDILTALTPALQAGLIVLSDGHLSFAHDRIQEAGYALIPKSDRPPIHLEIGRSLLASTKAEDLEQEIFTVVGHLNVGRASIDTDSEKIELAALNLAAGQKAKAASAFADAKEYIEIGLELLGTDHWQDQYDLTLSLHNEDGELAFLIGRYDQVANTAALIHANARHILDQVRIYMTQIEAATAQSHVAEGLELGLAALRDLAFEIPVLPTPEDGLRLHEKFVSLLTSKPMEQLHQLPRMSDETAMAASSLFASVMSTAYIANPPLFPIISYHGAILSFEFGLDVWSPFFIGGIALVTTFSITPDTPADDARRLIQFIKNLVKVIQALLDNPLTARSRTKGLMMLSFTTPWFEAYEDSIEFSRSTYDSGYETGDWLYGSYGAALFAAQSLPAGMNLPEYQRQLSAYRDSLQRMGQVMTPTILAIYLQTADNFMEHSPEPHCLKGPFFNEDEWLAQALAANDLTNRHYLSINKFILAYHFDRDDTLDEYAAEAEQFLTGGPGHLSIAQYYLYFALAKLRQIGRGNSTPDRETMTLVNKSLQWMALWADTTPSTFQNKYDLMAAEKARVKGDLEGALSHYERAINGAQGNGFTHEEALANELYARFWAERENDHFAGPLMREAHSLYRKWGALAKADHLAKRYPNWVVQRRVVVPDQQVSSTGPDLTTGDLDLLTVLKASQEIAGEIDLKSLLAKLLTIVMENAGAQQGYLLRERDGQWMVVARADIDQVEPEAIQSVNVEAMDRVSAGIVHYVVHTREPVVLNDAANEGGFVDDPTIQKRRPKSILCAPFLNQGKVSGIVYLENSLATGAFSPERVELINLLSSQMALALDNAQIYANLFRSEARYRGLVDNSIVGVFNSTLDGRYIFVNDAMARMFDFDSPEQMIAHGSLERWKDPKDREQMLADLQKQGRVTNFEAETVTHTDRHVHVLFSARLLDDHISGMVMDITERKEAEETLHKSRDFLEHLAASVPDAIFSVKIPERTINWVNDSFNVMGYEPEEYIGESTKKYFANPEDYDVVGELQKDALREGKDLIRTEIMARRKDGRVIPAELTATFYREKGRADLVTAMVRDITERKQAEENLAKSEAKYRGLVDNSLVGVFTSTLDDRFTFVNDAMARMFDFDNTELMIAQGFLERWSDPKDRERMLAELEKHGMVTNFEAETITHAGRHIHVLFSAKKLGNDIFGMVMDITTRKQAEQKVIDYQQRLKALASQLTIAEEKQRRIIAAGIHDQVGQSLALARMQIASARKSTSDSKLADKLEDISDTLLKSIENVRMFMLDLSSPAIHQVGLSSAISEWLESQIVNRHSLTIEFIDNVSENRRKTLDPKTRTILFRNVKELVVNVLKHARANKVSVRLEDRNTSIRIIVEDDGIGFEPSAVTQAGSETGGFGLFSIEELMADLGGDLKIVSGPGKGCTAILSAPLECR